MDTGADLDNIYAFEKITNFYENEFKESPPPQISSMANILEDEEFETQSDTENEHSFGDMPDNMCEVVIKAETEDEKDEHTIEQTFVTSKIVCDVCQKLFKTKDGLKQHIRFVHENEKKFCCEICTKKFATRYKLKYHTRDVHERSGDFACGFCGKRFFRECDKMLHEQMHTGEKPFQCDDCGRAFHKKEVLERHRHSVHSGIKYPCDLCQYEAKEISNLQRHKKTVHKNTVVEVLQAIQSVDLKDTNKKDDETIKEEDLKANVDEMESNIVHNEMNPKVTPDGEHLRTSESASNYGVKEETEAMNNDIGCETEPPALEQNLICDICLKNFVTKKSKQRHIRSVHGEKERNFFCEYCSKTFTRADQLAKHVKVVHDKIRDFSCGFCGKLFSDKYTKTIHERIHTDDRPCPEKEKSFCCEVCSKMFVSRRNMVNHVNSVHENIIKYSCELCDKCFSHKASLSKHHQSAHLGIKYQCQMCSYEAKEKGHLLRHQKAVHKNTEHEVNFD